MTEILLKDIIKNGLFYSNFIVKNEVVLGSKNSNLMEEFMVKNMNKNMEENMVKNSKIDSKREQEFKYKGTHQLLDGAYIYGNSVYEVVNNLLVETSIVHDRLVKSIVSQSLGKPMQDYDGKTIFLSYEDLESDVLDQFEEDGLSLDRKNFIVVEIIKDENGKISYKEAL